MPAFIRPTAAAPAALQEFKLQLQVTDASPTPIVDITFSAIVVDANGGRIARAAGDLAPFLTAQQVTNFTNAALALYAKALAELLA